MRLQVYQSRPQLLGQRDAMDTEHACITHATIEGPPRLPRVYRAPVDADWRGTGWPFRKAW